MTVHDILASNSMKEKRQFPLFNSPLDLAHFYWKKMAQKGLWAIDATCGNGHDTARLAELFEGVIAIDLQEKAIENTRFLVKEGSHVIYFCQSHEHFPPIAFEKQISLIVYNLGYLPGGNKGLTTLTSSTLRSLQEGLKLLLPGGVISLTCYPGHAEGALEEEALVTFTQTLDPQLWSVCHHVWKNRKKGPSLLLIQKNCI